MSWVISVGQAGSGGKKQGSAGKQSMMVVMSDGKAAARIKVTAESAGSQGWQAEQAWQKLFSTLVGID